MKHVAFTDRLSADRLPLRNLVVRGSNPRLASNHSDRLMFSWFRRLCSRLYNHVRRKRETEVLPSSVGGRVLPGRLSRLFGCTVCAFNIVLERLVSRLFCLKKQDLNLYSRLYRLFGKWSTINAVPFDVLQDTGVMCLSYLLRVAARGCYIG